MKLGFETQHPGERLNELDVCHVGKRLGNLAYDWTRTEVKHRCRVRSNAEKRNIDIHIFK